MMSSFPVAYLKGNIFGRTICHLSLIVVAFILAKLWGGGGGISPRAQKTKEPGLDRVKVVVTKSENWKTLKSQHLYSVYSEVQCKQIISIYFPLLLQSRHYCEAEF